MYLADEVDSISISVRRATRLTNPRPCRLENMTFWDIVWAAALGCAIAATGLGLLTKILGLIVKGMDK